MSTEATIKTSIESIDDEIAKLTAARETLVELLEGGEVEDEKPARRRRRESSEDDESKSSGRRTSRSGKRSAEREATSSKSTKAKATKNGKAEGGPTKKDQIAEMLEDGMSPREIADELGMATNYVYNVKRSLA